MPKLPTPNNTEPVPSDETRVRGPENLTLAIGSSGEAAGLDIAVLEIVSDNRCPSDVQCIQAGKVVVKIEVGSGLSKKQEILELPGKSILFDGYEVGLTEVRPVPQTKNPTTIADYRVTILVSPTAEGDNL